MAPHLTEGARDVSAQVEDVYCATPSNADCGSSSKTSPPRLTTELQRQCHAFLTSPDTVLTSENTPKRSSYRSGQRQQLENMLPPCRLMNLPAELREQIFAFAVTEWIDSLEDGVASRPVRFLQRRAIRIDRLNKPAPPGRRAAL